MNTEISNEEIAKLKTRLLHQRYWVGISALIAVVALGLAWGSDTPLTALISFAATLSSIILSVLAIFMTVLSSESINSLIYKFRELHSEIKDVPGSIKPSVDEMKSASSDLKSSVISINGAMVNVNKSICNLEGKLSEIKDNLAERDELLSASINNISEVVTNGGGNGKSMISKNDDFYLDFLNSSSLSGLLLLYGVKCAKNDAKKLDLAKLSVDIKITTADYLYGFAVASASARVIQYYNDNNDNNNLILSIINLNPIIEDNIESYIISACDRLNSSGSNFDAASLMGNIRNLVSPTNEVGEVASVK